MNSVKTDLSVQNFDISNKVIPRRSVAATCCAKVEYIHSDVLSS